MQVQHTICLQNMAIESLHSPFLSEVSAVDDDTKQIIRRFLVNLDYTPPHTRPNLELRHRLATQMDLWKSSLSPAFKYKLNEESCNIAEMTYGHTSTDHQYFIALFTACTIYADDHCACDPEPVGQFAERFAHGERQLDPVLDCLADHIKTAYEFWPAIGATAIISSTLDFMTAVYVENTKAITPTPLAPRFPYYFRSLSGLSPSYAYFIFPKSWRTGINSYLQLIPELCFTLNCANDVLSFYKECVAGETDNYINLCAAAEQKTPTTVLRDLANEVANTIRRVEALAAGDRELAVFCYKFFMGYIEFHVKTPRYLLKELGF